MIESPHRHQGDTYLEKVMRSWPFLAENTPPSEDLKIFEAFRRNCFSQQLSSLRAVDTRHGKNKISSTHALTPEKPPTEPLQEGRKGFGLVYKGDNK